MKYISRRQGKSVLPKLLKEFGFDKYNPEDEGKTIIIFNEVEGLDLSSLPTPIIKSGEIFTYSTLNKTVATETKEKPDKVK
jgi:hypothetical protein